MWIIFRFIDLLLWIKIQIRFKLQAREKINDKNDRFPTIFDKKNVAVYDCVRRKIRSYTESVAIDLGNDKPRITLFKRVIIILTCSFIISTGFRILRKFNAITSSTNSLFIHLESYIFRVTLMRWRWDWRPSHTKKFLKFNSNYNTKLQFLVLNHPFLLYSTLDISNFF